MTSKTGIILCIFLMVLPITSSQSRVNNNEEDLYGITPCDITNVIWESKIAAIMQKNCVMCHGPDVAYKGVRHDSYEAEMIVVNGGRYKLGSKFSINGEYYYLLPGKTANDYANSLSFGVDIDTGGHVFQPHFTNSQLMFAPGYIARTEDGWAQGDIFIGFNIFRVFHLNKKDKNIY
jgi:hypothetical protein